MKTIIRRIVVMMMCLTMLCTAALADTAGLNRAAQHYLTEYENVQFHASAQIGTLTPYGDGMLEQMNALLKNLSVRGQISNTSTEMDVCVAGESLVSLQEQQADVGTQLTTSLLPNRTLIGSVSAMDALSGFEQEENQFDFFTALHEAEACYQELTDAILPFAEEKPASYSIEKVGSARWVRLAKLAPEQSAEIQPLIAKVLGCGMDAAFREQLNGMTCQKNFTIALYRNKEGGNDIAVYIKGSVMFPDGKKRAISYQWAFATNDKGQRVDTYKFDMTKEASPRDNRQISASYKRVDKAGTLLVDGSSKAIIRNPETTETVTTTVTHKLNGKNGSVEGTVTSAVRTAIGETGKTETIVVTPKVQIKEAAGMHVLTGSARVEQQTGSTVHTSIDVLFAEEAAVYKTEEDPVLFIVIDERLPESSLNQNIDFGKDEPEEYLVGKPPIGYIAHNVPENETAVDLDSISPEELAALRDEMNQRLAGVLLKAVAKLPEDASALIRENMSEADYAAFLAMLEE